MRPMLIGLAVVVLVVGGCAAGTASPPPTASPTPVTAYAEPSQPAIVGEWVGIHDCERIVAMLGEAGLDEFLADAVYGNELVPGVTAPEGRDPTKPCDGAVEREHSHYFTAAGEFGSIGLPRTTGR
jgi:hypothetical protein